MFILFREAFSMIHAPFVQGITEWNVLYFPFLSINPLNLQNRSQVYDVWENEFNYNPYITSTEDISTLHYDLLRLILKKVVIAYGGVLSLISVYNIWKH